MTNVLRSTDYDETVAALAATDAIQALAEEARPWAYEQGVHDDLTPNFAFMQWASREFHARHEGELPADLHIGGPAEAILAVIDNT